MSDPLCRYLERPTRRRLARVVREYHGHVWSIALRVTGNRSDAEDICQDVFLALLLHPPAAGTVRSAKGYLAYRVVALARRAARTASRRHARERRVADRLFGDGGRVGAGADTELDVEALREALGQLAARVRTTLELKYLAGCTVAEIAAALEISERTVATDLQRGREELRTRLGKQALGALLLPGAIPSGESRETPPDLLRDLLKVVDRGRALAPAATPVLVGALAMKKSVTSLIGAVLLLLAIAVSVQLVVNRNTESPEQVAASPETPSSSADVPEGPPWPVRALPNSIDSPIAPVEAPQGELRGSITVTVRTPDGAAIGGARIERPFIDDTPTIADSNGVAAFENLPLDPGFVSLAVRADGWARRLVTDIVLDEETPHVRTDVVLQPECRIFGQVTNHLGNTLAGCLVTLSPNIGSGAPSWWEDTAISDAEGRFEFSHLASAVHVATASYEDLSARLFPTPDSLPHFATGEPKIEFSFDKSRTCSLDVVLYPSVHLSGWVRSLSGRPIAGATLQLEYTGSIVHWKTLRFGPTRENGHFVFPSCAPGLYTATVWAPGHRTLTEEIDLADPGHEAGTHEHDLIVEPGGIISGRLVRDGRPSQGKVAAFLKTAEGELRNLRVGARTTPDGTFACQTLDVGREPSAPDGTYVLRGLGERVSDIKTGYQTIVEPLATDVEVEVRGGVGPSDIVVEEYRGDCTVRGRVVYHEGHPYPGASLYLTSNVGEWKIEQPTHSVEPDGTFRIAQLPPGRTKLEVYPQDRSVYRIRKLDFVLEGSRADINLGDIGFEAAGNRSMIVRVTYLDPEADPEPGSVDVSLMRQDARANLVEKVVGGRAVFHGLDPGIYQPRVDFAAHLPVEIDAIDLQNEESVEIEVLADPGITVLGDVTFAAAFPVSDHGDYRSVGVWADYLEGGRLSRIARLQDDGRYRIQGLRKGRVTTLTLLGYDGRQTIYAELPGFSIVAQHQEISLGHVAGRPRKKK